MKIAASPAFNNKKSNPYNFLLYSELNKMDGNIVEGFISAIRNRADIWHVHWPEAPLNSVNLFARIFGCIAISVKLIVCKILHVKTVWTVHNLRPHEYNNDKIIFAYYRVLSYLFDGIIFLSHSNQKEFIELYGEAKKCTVIRHGHYIDYFSDDINRATGVEVSAGKNLLFFGQIRGYKDIPHLINIFVKSDLPSYNLIIAGSIRSADLRREIDEALLGAQSVKLVDKFFEDEELSSLINESSVTILPYRKVSNSGALLLSLSLSKPVIVPRMGSFVEIQEAVGSNWVQLYDGKLTEINLRKCIEDISASKRDSSPNLSNFSWDEIARNTMNFFHEIVGSK